MSANTTAWDHVREQIANEPTGAPISSRMINDLESVGRRFGGQVPAPQSLAILVTAIMALEKEARKQ